MEEAWQKRPLVALVGFQGLILKCASETLNLFIRPLKNNHLKGDAGRKNRVVRHCYIHDPGIQQEPLLFNLVPYVALRIVR